MGEESEDPQISPREYLTVRQGKVFSATELGETGCSQSCVTGQLLWSPVFASKFSVNPHSQTELAL